MQDGLKRGKFAVARNKSHYLFLAQGLGQKLKARK